MLQFVNVTISQVAKNLDNIYPGHFPSEFLCTAFDLFIFFAIISVVLFLFPGDVRFCRYAWHNCILIIIQYVAKYLSWSLSIWILVHCIWSFYFLCHNFCSSFSFSWLTFDSVAMHDATAYFIIIQYEVWFCCCGWSTDYESCHLMTGYKCCSHSENLLLLW